MPDVAQAEAVLDAAREIATLARAQAKAADEHLAEAVSLYNRAFQEAE